MRNSTLAITLLFGIALTISCDQPKGYRGPKTQEEKEKESQSTQVDEKQKKEPSEFNGFFCTENGEYLPLTYTRQYEHEGDNFTTIYKVSQPGNGYFLNIIATHYKSKKKIIINIDDVSVSKELGHISTQEFTYENPSLERFGRPNLLRANGMDEQGRLPNNLALEFTDSKFENINVVDIIKDEHSIQWYVLDEKK